MPLNLDYFYGGESEQYSFYRIPKVLFTAAHYRAVPVEAKVLYGLLLDRMALSARNSWLDEGRRVFIYFTLEDVMSMMGCGHNKAVRLFADLEQIGLIERRKQGQGRPTRIYVKNFILPTETEEPETPEACPDIFIYYASTLWRTHAVVCLHILLYAERMMLSIRKWPQGGVWPIPNITPRPFFFLRVCAETGDQREPESHAGRRVRPGVQAARSGVWGGPNQRFGIAKRIFRNIAGLRPPFTASHTRRTGK